MNLGMKKKNSPTNSHFLPFQPFINRSTSLPQPFTVRTFILLLLATFFTVFFTGCGVYSFSGASIPATVQTASVRDFPNQATTVAPNLSQTLTEKLRNKIESETRLDLRTDNTADARFTGAILEYSVTPAAAGANDQAALNRLTVTVRVEYANVKTNEG